MTRVTPAKLFQAKLDKNPIAMIACADRLSAQLAEAAGVELILVGDSLAMTFQGHDTTLPVTMDEMIYHTKVVRRGTTAAMVIADMPFLSYQISPAEAVRNAGMFLKQAGAHAVKMEGGAVWVETISACTKASIPVMGHIGLRPQNILQQGGYRLQATTSEGIQTLLNDAMAVVQAGVFAIVLEKVPTEVAALVSERVPVPVIGIGSGPHCDGQVLVASDLLGMDPQFKAKFVKRYANLHQSMYEAFQAYQHEVKSRAFPGEEHSYPLENTEVLKQLQ